MNNMLNKMQAAIMFEEGVTDKTWDAVVGVLPECDRGSCEVALLKAQAVLIFEANIPDAGESFDWITAITLYAVDICKHIIICETWPNDDDLYLMTTRAVKQTQF